MRICGFKWNSLSKWIFCYFLEIKKEQKREKESLRTIRFSDCQLYHNLSAAFSPQLDRFKMENAAELVIPNELSCSNPNKLFDA